MGGDLIDAAQEGISMILELSPSLAGELRDTVTGVLSEMSSEIADTDNASYRRRLEARRERLRSLLALLDGPEGT
jgi:hypothetical protein